mmetsp:Transcript_6636/g.6535  ORF Transcript_6636/g.6535 Transcript_6636/m.6535 type:complete len:1119 (+) Transcript_6636:403-3759(+)
MLGRLFKQNQPGSSIHTSNGNANYTGPAGANNSHANSYGTNQPKNSPISNPNTNSYQNVNTFEDSYSREILYGTSDILQLKPYQLNNKFFRIIISQDGGNLRSKQVLYDSAAQNNDNSCLIARPPTVSRNNSSNNVNSKNILTSKIYHNASELNDYMFGCGLPSNETYSTTKIHILPTLNNLTYGSNQSILITRLFLISDNNEILGFIDNFEAQWKPRPALPIKETSIKNYAFNLAHSRITSTDSNSANKSANGINSRFSIGLIIPLESANDHLNDVIFNNWDEISHYLIVLQKLIIKKLILTLNNSMNDLSLSNLSLQNNSPNHSHIYCPYIVNKRIQFPSYLLQNELDLNNQLIKLIKLMHYNTNVPKLINSNSLMRSSMNCSSKLNPMLFNWVSEVLNWLQFKDGRYMNNDITPQLHSSFNSNSQFQYNNSTTTSNPLSIQSSPSINNFHHSPNTDTAITKSFLSSLLALLIPLRKLLTTKPFSNSNDRGNTREITRVIVMTGNPVVAKKLIFIINGIIPDNEMLSILDDYDENSDISERSDDTKPVEHSIDKIPENKSEEYMDENTFSNDSLSTPCSVQQKLFCSTGDMNHANVLSGSKPVPTIPIPIKSSTASSYSSSDNSPTHTTSVKGWEIPHKSSASTTTTPFKSRVEIGTSVIPIAQKTPARSSLSKSSSMAYLSSSLTSSLSSSASNYSLSKLGGSFMEKWKNSFSNTQHTNPNVNSSSNQTNILLGFNPENHEFLPPTLGNLSKRNSVHSLRTPSPVVEMDDNLLFHNANIGSIPHNSSSSKMSRAQSMYDLYNNSNNKRNGIGMIQEEGKQSHMGVKRSNTSIYTSSWHDSCKIKNINDFNRNIIRTKCSIIMKANVSLGDSVDKTLNIESVMKKGGDESDSYYEDESTITSSKVNDIAPLIKHRPLSPNVAFAEEFRPEFILQSCPISSKLESQVMTSMKNDLLFYQNNCQFENVTSRSVFISLRAREIKMIEMNVGDAGNGRTETSPNSQASSNSGTPLGSLQESQKPSLQSALTIGIRNNKGDHNGVRRSSTASNSTASYKTVIKKIFSPTRNLGDKVVIHAIENTLDEINKLFQSYSNIQKNEPMSQEFNDKLTMLMTNILS